MALDKSNLKWISFIILILQTSTHTLVTRYSRLQPGPAYIPSTAVIMSEINKFVISLVIHLWSMRSEEDMEESLLETTAGRSRRKSTLERLYIDVFGPESDWVAMSVPAFMYFIQNVLNYWAATFLDPATFQITAQLKILTTAIFSVIMLGTKLTLSKWLLLTMVALGVVIIQIQDYSEVSASEAKNKLIGIFCVVLSSTTSGFAGIWFEKALKGKQTLSLFLRNLQLSLFSIIPGFIFGVCIMDGTAVWRDGFFSGYTIWTWLAILLQSLGGLLVSFVVKYADSIIKVLATTIAFLVSTVASTYIFGFVVGVQFVIGSVIVLIASQFYILGFPVMHSIMRKSSPLPNEYKTLHSVEIEKGD